MLVFWDHGSGAFGYGADYTCSSLTPYNDNGYCEMFSMQTLARGKTEWHKIVSMTGLMAKELE
jgi:hypothetical protein